MCSTEQISSFVRYLKRTDFDNFPVDFKIAILDSQENTNDEDDE